MYFCAERFGWTVDTFNQTSLEDILTLYAIALDVNKKTSGESEEDQDMESQLAMLKGLKEKHGKG